MVDAPPEPSRATVEKPGLLVVEGPDDEAFFKSLINFLALPDIQIFDIRGKGNFKGELGPLVKSAEFAMVRSLGIMRDADENATSAFQSICDILKRAGLPVPTRPLMPDGHNPTVTIMILPGNNKPGMAEDLCLEALGTDVIMGCIDDYFSCLKDRSLSLPSNMSKARMEVFIAAKDPGTRLARIADKGYWSWDHPAFDAVKDFLRIIAEHL